MFPNPNRILSNRITAYRELCIIIPFAGQLNVNVCKYPAKVGLALRPFQRGFSCCKGSRSTYLLRKKGLRKRQKIKEPIEEEREQGTNVESNKAGKEGVRTALL